MSGKRKTIAERLAENVKHQAEDEALANEKARNVTRRIQPMSGHKEACLADALEAVQLIQEYDHRKSIYVRLREKPKDDLRQFAQYARMLGRALDDISEFGFVGFEKDINAVGASMEIVLEFGRRCDEMVKAMGKPPNNTEAKTKHEAVRLAFWLIKKHTGETPTAGRNVTGKKEDRSKFSKVAAALWGHDDADLTSQCKKFIGSPEGKLAKNQPV